MCYIALKKFLNKSFHLILIILSQNAQNAHTEFHSFIFVFFNSLTLHKRECPIMICCFTVFFLQLYQSRIPVSEAFLLLYRFSLRIVMILTQTRFVHSINLDQYAPKII